MDWDSRDAIYFQKDVENPALIRYNARKTKVAELLEVNGTQQNRIPTPDEEGKDDAGLKDWLSKVTESRKAKNTKGVYVILGDRPPLPPVQPRPKSIFKRFFRSNPQSTGPDPLVLLNLPFLSDTFQYIINEFLINTSIIRTLNRPAAIFTRTHFKHGNSANELISYNIKDPTSLSTNLAMSITTYPSTTLTYVIVYGCHSSPGPYLQPDIQNFLTRLTHSGRSFLHPLLLAGLFIEIQRSKHHELVKKSVRNLRQYVINLSNNTLGKAHSDENAAQDGVDYWLDVSDYKVKLESWKAQISKMITYVDELETDYYGKKNDNKPGKVENEELVKEGRRIRERLHDILLDYDEMIAKCQRVIDGTNLANGTAWNHLARQDNRVMKAIALLAYFFLPATFVATFFAMPLLKWDADSSKGEKVYNPRTKYYWYAALPLTAVVVLLYFWFGHRVKVVKRKDEEEMV